MSLPLVPVSVLFSALPVIPRPVLDTPLASTFSRLAKVDVEISTFCATFRTSVSVPAPPSIFASVPYQAMESLAAPPTMESAPRLPSMESLPLAAPTIVSAAVVAMTFWKL